MAECQEADVRKKKRKTGDICSLKFCSKSMKDGVSLHKLPSNDANQRKSWLDFVGKTREIGHLKNVFICSDHFLATDYHNHLASEAQIGLSFKRYLKEGSVPSIYPVPTEEQLEGARNEYMSAKARGSHLPATACFKTH